MKTMKLLMMTLLVLLSSTVCNAREKVIKVKDLPVAAQTTLKTYFDGKKVTLAQKDKEGLITTYDVLLEDGTKLEFDSKGEWIEIDTKPRPVPSGLVPAAISDYVKKNYPDSSIMQIERDRRGYEIDLSNGLDLRFNKQFKLVKIDD